MKKGILIWAAVCVFSYASAQTPTSTDSLFMVTYSLGSAWDQTKKPHEQLYFKEHSSHLSSLRKAGTIKFGARYSDKGLIFISAPSYEKAKELITSDVAIKNGLFHADVSRMNVFYPYKE
jgi:hypothetical protein